jgi:hypothetical protein
LCTVGAGSSTDILYYTTGVTFSAYPGIATSAVAVTVNSIQKLAATGALTTVANVGSALHTTACAFAVKDVTYTIYYSGGDDNNGQITKVEADFVVYDIAIPGTAGAFATMKQGVRVRWLPSTVTTRPQEFSGNPGYLTGYPVLVRGPAAVRARRRPRPTQ